MDIVESEYMKMKYPDRQEEEVEEYSTCAGCRGVIYVGDDLVLDVYGMVSHDNFECLKKAVDATYVSTNERSD